MEHKRMVWNLMFWIVEFHFEADKIMFVKCIHVTCLQNWWKYLFFLEFKGHTPLICHPQLQISYIIVMTLTYIWIFITSKWWPWPSSTYFSYKGNDLDLHLKINYIMVMILTFICRFLTSTWWSCPSLNYFLHEDDDLHTNLQISYIICWWLWLSSTHWTSR